jgi:hypothetical protein
MTRLKIDSPRVPQIVRSPERKDVSIAVPKREVAPQRQIVDRFESGAPQRPQSSGGLWEGSTTGTATSGVKFPLPSKLEPHRATLDKVIDDVVNQFKGQTTPTSQKALKKALRTGLKEAGIPKNQIGKALKFYAMPQATQKLAGDISASGGKDHPWCALKAEVRTNLDKAAETLLSGLGSTKFGQFKKAINQAVKESGAEGADKKLAKNYLFFKLGELAAKAPTPPAPTSPTTPAPTPEKPFHILPHIEPDFVGRPVEDKPFSILPHEEKPFSILPHEEKPFSILPHEEPQFTGRPVEEKPFSILPHNEGT